MLLLNVLLLAGAPAQAAAWMLLLAVLLLAVAPAPRWPRATGPLISLERVCGSGWPFYSSWRSVRAHGNYDTMAFGSAGIALLQVTEL